MVSTFTTNLNIELPGHNDYVGTWDTPTNANWSLVDNMAGGSLLLNATGLSGTVALTNVQLQPRTIQISGAPTATLTYSVPSGVGGQWVVRNDTTGGIEVRVASAAGGPFVVIPSSYALPVWSDGTANGIRVCNSVVDSSGIHFPDGTQQSTANTGLQLFQTQNVSGVSTVDFINIGTSVNNLVAYFSLVPSTNTNVALQVYGTGGVLDTSAAYYSTITTGSGSAVANIQSGAVNGVPLNASAVDGSSAPWSGTLTASNIQAAVFTTFTFTAGYNSGAVARVDNGMGAHTVAANITGLRFVIAPGTFTGRISLYTGP